MMTSIAFAYTVEQCAPTSYKRPDVSYLRLLSVKPGLALQLINKEVASNIL